MPVFSDGQKMTSTEWARLIESVPASYVVWKDGATYCAECLLSGGTDYSGTDASTVIQAAIDALTNGGKIFLKAGIYDLTSASLRIIQKSNLIIKGEGMGATVLLNGGIIKNHDTATYNNVIEDLTIDINNVSGRNAINLGVNSYNFAIRRVSLKNTNNVFLFNGDYVDGLIVEDSIFYDGGLGASKDNVALTQLTTTENTTIFRNNRVIKEYSLGGALFSTGATGNLLICGNTFIDLSGNSYAAVSIENSFGNCKNIQVIGNFAYGAGIGVGTDTVHQIDYVQVSNNIVQGTGPTGSGAGKIIVYKARKAIVSNNQIFNTTYGIILSANDYVIASSNIVRNTNIKGAPDPYGRAGFNLSNNLIAYIIGNIVSDDAGTTPHGLRTLDSPTMRLYVKNNIFRGPFTSSAIYIITTLGYLELIDNEINGTVTLGTITEKIIKHNSGYVTENSGSSTGTGAQQTIPHGLVSTPYDVSITPTASGTTVSGLYADATNIYVTVTNGKTYNWSAEV